MNPAVLADAAAKLLQSCPTLCDPIDGSSVPGILQARILEWVAIGMVQKLWHSHAVAAAKSLQSCPTLCDPTDGSPPSWHYSSDLKE